MRRRLWLACAGLAIVSLAAAFALTRRGGQAVPPAAPGTITIDLPGSNRPWPLPAVDASPLNGAFASLGPSEIRTVRLSLARDADISFEGLIERHRGRSHRPHSDRGNRVPAKRPFSREGCAGSRGGKRHPHGPDGRVERGSDLRPFPPRGRDRRGWRIRLLLWHGQFCAGRPGQIAGA